jgi:hypothetical protein
MPYQRPESIIQFSPERTFSGDITSAVTWSNA